MGLGDLGDPGMARISGNGATTQSFEQPGSFDQRTSRLAALLSWTFLALALANPPHAQGQNPLLDAIDPTRGASSEQAQEARGTSSMFEIEGSLAGARQHQTSLERALEATGEAENAPSPPLELAGRLIRVLEQRREAQLRTDALELGREAIESLFARDPREIVGGPPPFPVPILDGIQRAWQRAAEQASQSANVLEDRRANRQLAAQEVQRLDKDRRRLREVVEGQNDEVERVGLEADLRALEDRLMISREKLALATQQVENATIEHEIKDASAQQTRAALSWVESQLSPREADLTDAIERLDRRRLAVDRQLDFARSQLVTAEETLRATEARRGEIETERLKDYKLEVATRRAQLTYRQQAVSLLSEQIERLGRMRTSWQHRYAVLGGEIDLAQAPAWRDSADNELERLTRLRRIHESELAQARLDLANLLRDAAEAQGGGSRAQRWLDVELEDLERVVEVYEQDRVSLDDAIQLDERLRAELLARMNDRNLRERADGLWASANSFWNYELTTSEDSPITPGKILIGLSIFVLGLWFARMVRGLLQRRLFPRVGFDAGASSAFASLTFYGLMAIAFLFALRAVNIPLTAFAVAGGALAIGVGFGSQTIISNFISGLLLLAERPIRTGDLVDIAGVIGTVESIGLRSTRIRTPDNFHIIVPNASFLESNVINWTHEDPKIRLRVQVGVAYGSPTRQVEKLLLQAAAEHSRTLPHPAAIAAFLDFGDSALLFEVRFWIRYDEKTDRSLIQSDLRFRIDELFKENGIEIAFPQIDVHLKSPAES
jgi:small-conductance mechanosensitive channel